jgi:hypothetical protein
MRGMKWGLSFGVILATATSLTMPIEISSRQRNGKRGADPILASNVLSGMNPAGILPDYPTSGADINGDGQIGFEEIIYILQKASSLR